MARVLLVDDEQNIRWTMSELLRRQDYETLTATDFDEALGILKGERVDVAVVDVILPGRNGIELLEEINSLEEYVPVVIMTGEPTLKQIPDLIHAGAYDFMAKPVLKDTLLKSVSRAVENKRLIDEKRNLEREIKVYAERLQVQVEERTSELAEAHYFLNTVLRSATEYAIIALDLDGRVTLFNQGAELMFGHTQVGMLGTSALDLLATQDGRERLHSSFAVAEEQKGGHKTEMEFCRADRAIFAGAVTVTALRTESGEFLGYLVIVKDLTEERRTEASMRAMEKRLADAERIAVLGRVAAQIAHEVKNPLAGLKLYALHLSAKLSVNAVPAEVSLSGKIVKTIDHLSNTVERVLDFARPISMSRSIVELNAIVHEAIQVLEPEVSTGQILVELDLCESGAKASVDVPSIRAALINLVLNAAQAINAKGKITVRTRGVSGRAIVEIADTGCGMNPEEAANLFQPFYTTKARGLGLGVFYAKRVVDEHRGTITIASHAGEGTRVEITLPAE
ncbi:MAG TPA: response regulator [Blastocatellia bacterium]|nr:response regulator [Blastocatellia bacterium]